MDEIVWGMSWEDWAGNFCYLLLAVSYLVTSLLWLRIFAIAALGLEGIYFYFASTPPLWVGIARAAVFVGINLFQIMRMTRERLAIRMTETERLLHRGLFKELGRVGFHRLLKIGAWRQMPAGTVLTSQGEPVPELYFISRGVARVIVDGKDVAAL